MRKIRKISPVLIAAFATGLIGCSVTDTSKMRADIDQAAGAEFGPFMAHLVQADFHLRNAEGIYARMTQEPEVYGNKPRFQEAGELHALLALEHRNKASQALHTFLTERFGHLEEMHVPKEIEPIVTQVYFSSGSAALSSEAHSSLKQVATVLKTYPSSSVGIVGFTDTVSTAEYNKRLAQRRVNAVFDALVGMGAPRKLLETAAVNLEAFGEAQGSDNTANRENRRVEVRVQPHGRPLADS